MKVIVFGATGGVGSAVVREIKASGHEAFIVGRNADKVAALREETGFGGAILESVDAAFTQSGFDQVDGVVSCVGTFPMQPIDKIDEASVMRDITEQIAVALSIVTASKRHVAKGGSVVFLSSVVTQRGAPAHVAIGAAKGAIEAMARSAAAEMAKQGVRVNSLALGLTKTDATKRIWSKDGAVERLAGIYPLGFNEPADVAKAVAFLLGTPGITGQTVAMDGGFSAIYAG